MRSRHWTTPLHHLATVGADRARALLRGGANLRAAAAGEDAPTPVSLAERLRAEGSAPAGSAADLVLRAAEPWSPQTHQLFPSEARARAVELTLLGSQLERWTDVWMVFVVPYAVTPDYQAPFDQLLARCSRAQLEALLNRNFLRGGEGAVTREDVIDGAGAAV